MKYLSKIRDKTEKIILKLYKRKFLAQGQLWTYIPLFQLIFKTSSSLIQKLGFPNILLPNILHFFSQRRIAHTRNNLGNSYAFFEYKVLNSDARTNFHELTRNIKNLVTFKREQDIAVKKKLIYFWKL